MKAISAIKCDCDQILIGAFPIIRFLRSLDDFKDILSGYLQLNAIVNSSNFIFEQFKINKMPKKWQERALGRR